MAGRQLGFAETMNHERSWIGNTVTSNGADFVFSRRHFVGYFDFEVTESLPAVFGKRQWILGHHGCRDARMRETQLVDFVFAIARRNFHLHFAASFRRSGRNGPKFNDRQLPTGSIDKEHRYQHAKCQHQYRATRW